MTNGKALYGPLSPAQRMATQRVAIVRALHLGDLLLAVPAFRAIRRGFPGAEITLIGLPWSAEFADRFSRYIDRWREFPGYPGLLEVDVDLDRTRRFLDEERRYRYDLVIALHGNGTVSNRFALELGGKCTAGFYVKSPPEGRFVGAPYPDGLQEIHRNLAMARVLGIPGGDDCLEFPLLDGDEASLQAEIQGVELVGRRVVGLHPGGRCPSRRWPTAYFIELADALAERFGVTIILTGGPGEAAIADSVARRLRAPALNLAERTTLGGLAALLRRLDLFISNDTGPAHIAVALGRPSISIFGPADRRRWAPLDQSRHRVAAHPVDCSPCPHWECPIDHRCLRWIEPAQVLELASDLLGGSGAGGAAS